MGYPIFTDAAADISPELFRNPPESTMIAMDAAASAAPYTYISDGDIVFKASSSTP